MFHDCKYTKWYFSIINNAKNEKGEKHHIIPKSLGGTNNKENMVILSLKEHYIVHILLPKMCIDSQHRYKMIWALHRMTFSGKFKLNSRHYEKCRILHKENIKLNHPSKKCNNYSLIMSERSKKSYIKNPDLRNLRSNTFLNFWSNTETRLIGIENNKKNSLKGAEAAKKALKGIPNPKSSMPGDKNPMARNYIIQTPANNIIEITSSNLITFCNSEKISKNSLIRYRKTKGYKVISDNFLRERRVRNG